MYKLIVDREAVDNFESTIAPSMGINPATVNPAFYHLLRVHSRPLLDSIFGESIPTVRFLVTIRTDLSDEVLVPTGGSFYTDCTAYYPYEHPIDDAVLLASKKLVTKLFDCGELLPQFIPRTLPYPLGGCVIDGVPYVYVNVIIDHTLLNTEGFKLKDCTVHKISDLTPTTKLEEILVSSLTIVKGDK